MYKLISFDADNVALMDGDGLKVCLYARVSKAGEQNVDNQLLELRRWASVCGHTIVGEFVDELSSRGTRPQKEKVLRLIRLGEADGVCIWSLDRWGRNTSEVVGELEEFARTGKSIFSLKEGLDLSNAGGVMMANMLAVLANFERARLRERTLAGLSRARAQGKRLGRPPTLDTEKMALLRSQGANNTAIAKELGVSRTAVWKALRVNKPPAENPNTISLESVNVNKTVV